MAGDEAGEQADVPAPRQSTWAEEPSDEWVNKVAEWVLEMRQTGR